MAFVEKPLDRSDMAIGVDQDAAGELPGLGLCLGYCGSCSAVNWLAAAENSRSGQVVGNWGTNWEVAVDLVPDLEAVLEDVVAEEAVDLEEAQDLDHLDLGLP